MLITLILLTLILSAASILLGTWRPLPGEQFRTARSAECLYPSPDSPPLPAAPLVLLGRRGCQYLRDCTIDGPVDLVLVATLGVLVEERAYGADGFGYTLVTLFAEVDEVHDGVAHGVVVRLGRGRLFDILPDSLGRRLARVTAGQALRHLLGGSRFDRLGAVVGFAAGEAGDPFPGQLGKLVVLGRLAWLGEVVVPLVPVAGVRVDRWPYDRVTVTEVDELDVFAGSGRPLERYVGIDAEPLNRRDAVATRA